MTGYAVIDVETTGLSSRNDRVIELAVVHTDTHGTITGHTVGARKSLGTAQGVGGTQTQVTTVVRMRPVIPLSQ